MIEKLMNALIEFRGDADRETFNKIFGNSLDWHLWNEYVTLDYDIVRLWGRLDSRNRAKLAAWLAGQVEPTASATCLDCGHELHDEDGDSGRCLNCIGLELLDEARADGSLAAAIRLTTT